MTRIAVLAGAALVPSAPHAAVPKTVTFTPFISGITALPLNKPIFFAENPAKPGYYIVLEQHLGKVSVFHKPVPGGSWVKTEMDTVTFGSGVTAQDEMGLLGMAFHPNFAQNRRYYLYYTPTYNATTGSRTYVVERQADTSFIKRNMAMPSRILLNFTGPYGNHKAGTMDFGPQDGYLYIAVGDGGGTTANSYGNDIGNRAQNPDSLLGKFLRINVDTTANGKQYGIPADNPYAGGGGAPEIYALGFRNPFKWSFDPLTGRLWSGEVGQDAWESVQWVKKGGNYGWRILEGSVCNAFHNASCTQPAGYQKPVFSYPQTPLGADSTGDCIIGGYVYRGNPASPYYGLYFFADNIQRRVWAARADSLGKQEYALVGTVGSTGNTLTSLGRDRAGNLYVIQRGTNSTTAVNGTINVLGGPDLIPVSVAPRRARMLAPLNARNLEGLVLHDLGGRKVTGASLRPAGSGVYIARRPGEKSASLVPVLK